MASWKKPLGGNYMRVDMVAVRNINHSSFRNSDCGLRGWWVLDVSPQGHVMLRTIKTGASSLGFCGQQELQVEIAHGQCKTWRTVM